MSESNGPALGEVAEAFARARDELTRVSGQLREFEEIAELRRGEQASIESASEQLRGVAGSIAGVIQRLDGAVGQVEEVLGAAKSALQATDATRLMDRLVRLEERIAAQEEAVGTRVDTVQREVALVAAGMEKVAGQDQTRLALQNDNRQLREQLNLVRAGLKPRQLQALGLHPDEQPRV